MKLIGNSKVLFVLIIVLSVSFLYFYGRGTYTSYESSIDSNAVAKISDIKLKINGRDVTDNSEILDSKFFMDNIEWNSTHTRDDKISPGSSGVFQLELDPSGSEVAILFDFEFIDKLIDNDKYLNFGDITSQDNIVRTDIDTYSGIITLDDIKAGKKINFNIEFYFDWLEDIEGIENDSQTFEDLFEIVFHAVQYRGEELIAYKE